MHWYITVYIFIVILSVSGATKKPHIIFIVADDLGWNDVGWNNPDIKTPNLDKLAAQGVRLNNSYVQPICTPSRSSFLTGVYPFRMGLQRGVIRPQETKHIPLKYKTLPEKLRENGYTTHMVGKWHLGFCSWNYTPTYRGFDSFLGFYTGAEDYYKHTRESGYDFRFNKSVFYTPKKQYSTKTFASRSIDIMRETSKGDKPLFLYLSFQSVHTPLQSPRRYQRMYRHIQNKQRRIYSGMVTAMDDAVGAVVGGLRKYKMLRNSIIVFTTDNGGVAHIAGSNYPLRGSKTTLWEGGTRAVSLVYSRRLLRKRRYVNNGLFHATDWYPTLLGAAGISTKGLDIDGINQWPMLRNRKPSRRKDMVYNIDRLGAALRMGDYKLIVGSPGMYNDWYRIPKTASVCRKMKEYEDETNDVFLHGINNAVRNVGTYFKWITSKVTGYQWLQARSNRLKNFQRCKKQERQQNKKFRFPKYHLYNLRDDPEERQNIAGRRVVIFRRLKKRLDKYISQKVPPQSSEQHKEGHWSKYNGIWTPGWCDK